MMNQPTKIISGSGVKLIFLFLFSLMGGRGTGSAQAYGPRRPGRIESLKIAYISQKLDLSPEVAQKFWPIYNSFHHELQALINSRKSSAIVNIHLATATDEQVSQALQDEFIYEEKVLELRKRYNMEYLKVLPARKVVTLYKAERAFRGQLIKELRERGENVKKR
ncbi:MAG: hypothetical protein ACYCOO_04210 [Chitinophagaceae bacterium]